MAALKPRVSRGRLGENMVRGVSARVGLGRHRRARPQQAVVQPFPGAERIASPRGDPNGQRLQALPGGGSGMIRLHAAKGKIRR
jgi:hypothetical protein